MVTGIVTQRLDVVASYGRSEMLHNLSTISCTINRCRDIDIVLKVESPFSGSYRIPWNFPFFTLRIPHFGSGTCWS